MDEKTKIARINKVVTDYFSKNPEEEEISAKDLMPEFVEAGIWKKSHASYLRKLLRVLDRRNELYKIPFVFPERKKNKYEMAV